MNYSKMLLIVVSLSYALSLVATDDSGAVYVTSGDLLSSLRSAVGTGRRVGATTTELDSAIGLAGAGGGLDAGKIPGLTVWSDDSTDALAKIALLYDSLPFFPGKYQDSSLLHGANLYENNVINGLYVLLVAAKDEMRDGNVFTIPSGELTIDPLGKLLAQLFYRHGSTLAPTRSQAGLAYYLTPIQWGQIYAASFDFKNNEDLIKSFKPKNLSWPQFNKFFDVYKTIFSVTTGTQRNLARSILMAFCWAKFVNNHDLTVVQARQNLANLYDGIKNIKNEWSGAVMDLGVLSALAEQVIKNINLIYTAGLPNPPVQGNAFLADGAHFPDCGESCWRGLFLAAFYQSDIQKIFLPDRLAEPIFYDIAIVDYFNRFASLLDQNTHEARNAWAQIISHRPYIDYVEAGYDVKPEFRNMMCLLAQLVPGSYRRLLISEGHEIDLSPKAIYDYLHDNLAHAQKLLEQFAADHGLEVFDFENKEDNVTDFKLRKIRYDNKEPAMLVYSATPIHMDCKLKLNIKNELESADPLIVCNKLNLQEPIIFAAYDIANNGIFKKGYLALVESVTKNEIDYIINNIKAWKMLRPEDQKLLDNPAKAAGKATKFGLSKAFDILLDKISPSQANKLIKYMCYKDLDTIQKIYAKGFINDRNINETLLYAFSGNCLSVEVVRFLLEKGANVNYVDVHGNSAAKIAILKFGFDATDEDVENMKKMVQLLLKYRANFTGLDLSEDLIKKLSPEIKALLLPS